MKEDMKIVRGDSFNIRCDLFSLGKNGAQRKIPRRFSPEGQYILRMDIKKTVFDSEPVISKECTFSAGRGIFCFVPRDTSALAPGKYCFDIRLTGEDGHVYTVYPMRGMKLCRSVTDIPGAEEYDPGRIASVRALACFIIREENDGEAEYGGFDGETVSEERIAELFRELLEGTDLENRVADAVNDIINGEDFAEFVRGIAETSADEDARAALASHTAAADNPHNVTLAQAGGIGANLLINPDFKINQRGLSGEISETGYFVDRWWLTSGSRVIINGDGSLTLYGRMFQLLDYTPCRGFVCSVSAGQAEFHYETNAFSVSANGETITWAKMEYGTEPTPFVPPDPVTELIRCQRYYQICGMYYKKTGYVMWGTEWAGLGGDTYIPKRVIPSNHTTIFQNPYGVIFNITHYAVRNHLQQYPELTFDYDKETVYVTIDFDAEIYPQEV